MEADWIVDFGPGARQAGRLHRRRGAAGAGDAAAASLTGAYLSGRRRIEVPDRRRHGNGQRLVLRGATANNLKELDVELPLGTFTAITGVSGAGKSTLVNRSCTRRWRGRSTARATRPGRTARSWGSSTRQGDRHRPEADRAARRAATRPRTRRSSTRSARSSPARRRRARTATSRAASASTSRRPLRGVRGRPG